MFETVFLKLLFEILFVSEIEQVVLVSEVLVSLVAVG